MHFVGLEIFLDFNWDITGKVPSTADMSLRHFSAEVSSLVTADPINAADSLTDSTIASSMLITCCLWRTGPVSYTHLVCVCVCVCRTCEIYLLTVKRNETHGC